MGTVATRLTNIGTSISAQWKVDAPQILHFSSHETTQNRLQTTTSLPSKAKQAMEEKGLVLDVSAMAQEHFQLLCLEGDPYVVVLEKVLLFQFINFDLSLFIFPHFTKIISKDIFINHFNI